MTQAPLLIPRWLWAQLQGTHRGAAAGGGRGEEHVVAPQGSHLVTKMAQVTRQEFL